MRSFAPFRYRKAIVRALSDTFATQAIRQHAAEIRGHIAKAQHNQYVAVLRKVVDEVIELPSSPDIPDACFIEDTAVVIGNTALITVPGNPARRAETELVHHTLLNLGLQVVRMHAPALLDGGDVLFTGREIFFGVGGRSNRLAGNFLQAAFPQFPVTAVPLPSHGASAPVIGTQGAFSAGRHNRVGRTAASIAQKRAVPKADTSDHLEAAGPLHLKSIVSMVGVDTVAVAESDYAMNVAYHLQSASQVNRQQFPLSFAVVPDEAAANAIFANNTLIYRSDKAYARSAEVLRALSKRSVGVDVSELGLADGALTCCSLLIP